MLIDEYDDFEDLIIEMLPDNNKETTCVSNIAKKTETNLNKSIKLRTFKYQCDSIELSSMVKVYFEPSLAKKFS